MNHSLPFDVDNWDSLSFHDKVQAICDIADELPVEDFLARLMILGTSLNCYPHARRYLIERLVAMMMQCEASRLDRLRHDFSEWTQMLSDLTFIEVRYIDDLFRSGSIRYSPSAFTLKI